LTGGQPKQEGAERFPLLLLIKPDRTCKGVEGL
jgi:hypothetical protein